MIRSSNRLRIDLSGLSKIYCGDELSKSDVTGVMVCLFKSHSSMIPAAIKELMDCAGIVVLMTRLECSDCGLQNTGFYGSPRMKKFGVFSPNMMIKIDKYHNVAVGVEGFVVFHDCSGLIPLLNPRTAITVLSLHELKGSV